MHSSGSLTLPLVCHSLGVTKVVLLNCATWHPWSAGKTQQQFKGKLCFCDNIHHTNTTMSPSSTVPLTMARRPQEAGRMQQTIFASSDTRSDSSSQSNSFPEPLWFPCFSAAVKQRLFMAADSFRAAASLDPVELTEPQACRPSGNQPDVNPHGNSRHKIRIQTHQTLLRGRSSDIITSMLLSMENDLRGLLLSFK